MFRKRHRDEEPVQVRRLAAPAWKATPPKDLALFIRNLHVLLPGGSVLVLEDALAKDIIRFLSANQAQKRPTIARDTSWPRRELFHLPVEEKLLGHLADLVEHHAEPEVCGHLKAYLGDQTVFLWTDVPDDPWYLAGSIDEHAMKHFCAIVGCTCAPCTEDWGTKERC